MRRFCKKSVSPVVVLASLVLILVGRAASDSLNLRLAGSWPFSGTMAVLGVPSRGLVFCGSGGGVYVLDASDPANPRQISDGIRTHGIIGALAYDSVARRLYVAARHAGLEIWDVSDSTQPVFLGACRTPWYPSAVVMSGSYAYVADRDSGLRIIDVSDPTNPYQVGRFDSPGSAMDVAVSGGLACLADNGALRIVNIVNPANPYETGHCLDSVNQILAVVTRDTFAYVADGYHGLDVVNIANSGNPFQVGNCPTPSHACDVALKDNYAYVADDMYGFIIADISSPSNPVRVGGMTQGGKSVFSIADTFAYVIGQYLYTLSIGDRLHPRQLGYYHAPGLRGSCAVSGDYAYIGSDIGLLVISTGDLTNMREVGSCAAGADDIVIRGQYAYAPCSGGFGVIDISSPANPIRVGFCMLGDPSVRVALAGNLACVLCQNSVRLVDVTDPTQPTVVGVYDSLIGGTDIGIAIRDSLAYVAEDWEGLRILSISDPTHPVQVGHLPMPHYATDIAILGDYAYIADLASDSGLIIVNIADPSNPWKVGRYRADGGVSRVAAQGRYIYVTGFYNALLQILDASDPTAPVAVARYDDGGRNPVPVGAYVFVGSSGLRVYEQIGYGIEEGKVRNAPDDGPRLLCRRLSGGSLGISFVLPEETSVGFRLYDLAGREMAQLPSVRYDRGKHLAVLSVGHLSNGVYFVKSNPPMTEAGKAVVCK